MYDTVKGQVKSKLSEARQVALTTDGWTSRSTESYVTITACFIDNEWKLNNYILQTRAMPESHTGVNIASVIKEAIIEWGLPATPPLVTDNASNMTVAAKEANCFPHIGCYAHTLNLGAQKCLKINTVSRLLGRMRSIVAYFHRSNIAAAALKEKIKSLNLINKKLIIDICTRWNSTVDMIERFLELQPAVYSVLMSREFRSKERELSNLSDADISLAEDILTALVPLRTVTTALCKETTPTVSVILPVHLKLINETMKPKDDDPPAVRQMKQIVVDDLNTRYTDPQIQDFLEEVTALDTRFKVSFLDENTQLQVYSRLTIAAADNWNETTVVVKREPDASMDNQHHTEDPALPTLPPEVEPDSISITSKENKSNPSVCSGNGIASVLGDVILVKVKKGNKSALERAEEEVKCYKLDDNTLFFSDPLLWWKNNEYKYPLLSSIAKKRLCIPATSVPSERVFSTAGDIVTAQRASLTSEHVDMLLFLKKNMK